MLPATLSNHADDIRAIRPDEQRIDFGSDSWKRGLPESTDVAIMADRLGGSISRADIRTIAAESIGDRSMLRQLFVAAMMFGYGTVGYGKFRTGRMLAGLD